MNDINEDGREELEYILTSYLKYPWNGRVLLKVEQVQWWICITNIGANPKKISRNISVKRRKWDYIKCAIKMRNGIKSE